MIFSKICAPKVPKETLRKPIIAPNLIKIGFIIIHITLSSFLILGIFDWQRIFWIFISK